MPFVAQYKPDILCLQETKAEKIRARLICQNTQSIGTRQKKGIQWHGDIHKRKPISVSQDFPESILKKYKIAKDEYGNPNKEGRVLCAEYKNFYLVNVYTQMPKMISRLSLRHKYWDPAFLEYVKELKTLRQAQGKANQ